MARRSTRASKLDPFRDYIQKRIDAARPSRLPANAEVGRWLREVANARVHATTGKRPMDQLALEQAALVALPLRLTVETPKTKPLERSEWPTEPLQRPPSYYDVLLAQGIAP